VKSWTWETLTSFEVLINAVTAALCGYQKLLSVCGPLVNLQNTHTHSKGNTSLLALLHFQVPQNHPWQERKDEIHASRVSYNIPLLEQ
jgi:hypothetical protein